jgi:hypothetical protein
MSGNRTYCSAFLDDIVFGEIPNSFLFRWSSSCIANPEYEPEDMFKAILHALASSKYSGNPFLVVIILVVWDDTPLISASIRGHRNMTTLIRISTGHMRFVPAHRQSDDNAAALSLAKWPVDFDLVSNEAGHNAYLDQSRIRTILAHAIQDTCRITPDNLTSSRRHKVRLKKLDP